MLVRESYNWEGPSQRLVTAIEGVFLVSCSLDGYQYGCASLRLSLTALNKYRQETTPMPQSWKTLLRAQLMIQRASEPSSGIIATLIAGVTLLAGASGVFA